MILRQNVGVTNFHMLLPQILFYADCQRHFEHKLKTVVYWTA